MGRLSCGTGDSDVVGGIIPLVLQEPTPGAFSFSLSRINLTPRSDFLNIARYRVCSVLDSCSSVTCDAPRRLSCEME